jgi:HD-GYP domain-containing protein (c-di-GMP phosphodiesterase class II)
MSQNYDEHYIASVTALGDTQPVLTSQALFSNHGIKLLDKGVRVTSAYRERLMQHKLLPAIDQSLTVAGGVTQLSLQKQAREILDGEPWFAMIREATPDIERLYDAFAAMPLPAPLAFKLTVAREQRPDIFQHSLLVTLIALLLAIKSHLSDSKLAAVAAVGMFHDIGELHIDPELLRPGHRPDVAELRHIYAHPMTAFLILQECLPNHPEISNAVFQHHERMDGSGYPRGLKGAEINPLGQMLMLADAVSALLKTSWSAHGSARLSVMMRMNRRKFSPELVDLLGSLLNGGLSEGLSSQGDISAEAAATQMNQLAEVFRSWDEVYQSCLAANPQAAKAPLIVFVNERITSLERTLIETGFHAKEVAMLITSVKEDQVVLAEMQLVGRESQWQVSAIMREVQRRWLDLAAEVVGRDVVGNWINRTKELLES